MVATFLSLTTGAEHIAPCTAGVDARIVTRRSNVADEQVAGACLSNPMHVVVLYPRTRALSAFGVWAERKPALTLTVHLPKGGAGVTVRHPIDRRWFSAARPAVHVHAAQ